MEGRERPRRPAILDNKDAELIWGDSDPALTSEAAHSTANAVLYGPSHLAEDEGLARRVGAIIDAEGLDEIAGLWHRSPATTLPGALWRLYLLRAWLSRDPETITMRFRAGATNPADDAAADPVAAPQPSQLDEWLDTLFAGTGEVAVAEILEQSAAFLRVLAAGAATDARWKTHDDDAAHSVTRRPNALAVTADELAGAAARARAGTLD